MSVVGTRLSAQVTPTTTSTPMPRTIARGSPRVIRIATWNIGANSVVPAPSDRLEITSDARPAAFARVLRALDPDIVCLNELTIGASRAAAMLDRIRPLSGSRWHAYTSLGNVLLSRYPLLDPESRVLRQRLSQRSHVIASIALPDSVLPPATSPAVTPEAATPPVPAPRGMVAVCTHLQAKDGAANLAFRERQAARIIEDLAARSARAPRHDTSPVAVMGDLNAIDRPAPYLLTLRQGDASRAFPLADAKPSHNATGPDLYTWRDDTQRFPPGVLDYILFSERWFIVRNAFVLNTVTLDAAALDAFRLRRSDTQRDAAAGVYDHLPVVVDLELVAR